ncbi:MAG TPA: chemotaxis protein CheB [Fervidobacterium sp.]|nr:chemotaxis protein CheB [Fervidobacterium sp.]HRD19627.1 chemotaxis protein CheB [Fervidobacterium sp.]
MRKIIIVGSAGSPPDVIEILKFGEKLKMPVIVCVHFTGSVIETFAEHIQKETNHEVEIVTGRTLLQPKVYLPSGGKDIVFINDKMVDVLQSSSKVHPSISTLFASMEKYASRESIVIILSGLGDDGKDFANNLQKSGVKFIIQKNPRFRYLPENISRVLEDKCERMETEKIKEALLTANYP